MRTTRNRGVGRPVMLAGLTLWAVVGCSGDDLPRRYPVSGTVTYKGAAVEAGTITFTPTDPSKGRSAGGTIVKGDYSLTSFSPDDGAVPGSYKVTVMAEKRSVDGADAKTKLMFQKAMSTGGVPIPPRSESS